MKKKILILIVVLAACIAASIALWMRHAKSTITLTEADNGRTVTVPLGATVRLRLTGGVLAYSGWKIEPPTGDALAEIETLADDSGDNRPILVGSPPKETRTYVAGRVGRSILTANFVNFRPPPATGPAGSPISIIVDVASP